MSELLCPYCGNTSKLVTGKEVYPHRHDLHDKYFYTCAPCKAWVGCHPGTTTPLGRLANAELRRAKSKAHAAFDPLWKTAIKRGRKKKEARSSGYAWLSEQLNIHPDDCHIGMFDVDMCSRVVDVCEPFTKQREAR